MKNLCLFLIFSLFPLTVFAQPERWQQRANYEMNIDMDVEKNQYHGTQRLAYTNNSPDTLDKVFYHLYFNAFQPGSMMDVRSRNIADPDPRVGSRILNLKPEEQGWIKVKALKHKGKDVRYVANETILEVALNEPILPGSTTLLETTRRRRRCAKARLVLLLSDRYLAHGTLPMHALLATGAVHHRLVKTGLRSKCNLLVETGTARDPHHFACLIGYGATAVYPYLAYQTLFDLGRSGALKGKRGSERAELGRSYRRGIKKGLLKIISKMGISTIGSYRGAQLFEIVGLAPAVVARCFEGTPSRVGGAGFAELEDDARGLAARAWGREAQEGEEGNLVPVQADERVQPAIWSSAPTRRVRLPATRRPAC